MIEQSAQKHNLMKRVGEVDDVARTILFLASDAAPYMIGQHVVVDGGLTENRVFLNK